MLASIQCFINLVICNQFVDQVCAFKSKSKVPWQPNRCVYKTFKYNLFGWLASFSCTCVSTFSLSKALTAIISSKCFVCLSAC